MVKRRTLINSKQERQYHDGRFLLGWVDVYRDLGIEVDVKADQGETFLDRDYGDYQW
jgi:hypothetical protein